MTSVRTATALSVVSTLAAVTLLTGCAADAASPVCGNADPAAADWPLGSLRAHGLAATGAGVTVAVVDSGLAPGIVPDDAVSTASASFVPSEALEADDGHGTNMAELVHTVAPDAEILALKAADRTGGARTEWVADAVDAATAAGADVISLSLETGGDEPALRNALHAAAEGGATLVIAAGNQQLDLDRFPRYPAAFDVPGSIVVAAVDEHGDLGAGTNWGAETVDAAAPGVAIPVTPIDGSPAQIGGSSPAAALTAGAVAALVSSGADDPTTALLASTSPRDSLEGRVATGGTLDLAAALGCPSPTPPDPGLDPGR